MMTDKRDWTADIIKPMPYPSALLWLSVILIFGPFVIIILWQIALYITRLNFVGFAENILTPKVLPTLILMCAIFAWEIAAYRKRFNDWRINRRYPVETKEPIALSPIRYGVIYVIKRSDGVYKIGKTYYLRNRLRSHRIDYGQGFDVIASWVVPDADRYERVALGLTINYHHSEGNRRELRKMTDAELSQFVLDFTERVYDGLKENA